MIDSNKTSLYLCTYHHRKLPKIPHYRAEGAERWRQSYFICGLLILVALLLNFTRNGVSQSQVRNLPGFDGPLPFHLETGYVNIDENDDIQLFYCFFKSENNPVEDPLIIWFTGCPGCSGLSAILYENGLVAIKVAEYNGSIPTLELNPYSWTTVSNMVFIDAPVGTGFSYSGTLESSYSTDTISGQQGYIFIKKI